LADEIAVPRDGMNASDIPTAAISEAGSTSAAKLPSARTSDSPAIPVARIIMPATIGGFGPKREITRGATKTMSAMIVTVIGSSAAPPEGAKPEHLLQVEVQEEPHRDPRGAEQQLGEVGRREVRRAQDAQAHERFTKRRLHGDERRQQGETAGEDQQRGRRPPARSAARRRPRRPRR
jgi:hypothetical protein